jgi:hypothetical protein
MGVIWTGKAPVPTTFHLSGGALVFASALLLFLMIYRLGRPHAAVSAPEETMTVSPSRSRAAAVLP